MPYSFRVAAIDVSHWHARYDAALLPNLRDLGVTMVGMSDRDLAIAQRHAGEFGGDAFSDYRDMVDATKPDLVIAMGRHVDMPDTFRFLVEAGVPFIMEKPWGTDAKTVHALVDLAEAKGAWAAVPYQSRYLGWTVKAKQMIDAAEFGAISHIQFRSIRPRQRRYAGWDCDWMYDREATGGGCLINLGGHGFDVTRYLTGEEPEVISAVISNNVDGLDVEEYALATMRTPSGIIVNNEMAYMMPAWPGLKSWPKNMGERELKIFGDKAVLRTVPQGLQILRPDSEEILPNPPPSEVGYPRALKLCLEALANDEPPPIPARACARAMDLIQDAYRLAGRA